MIFNGIRLDDEIRIALEEERLVIFVGAGVSVPPPSNLPLFNGLASQICGRPVANGTEDRELGTLTRDGSRVHDFAAQILYHENTKPTQLHREILRLFGKPGRVRVVTTNFDDHFSATGRKVFGKHALREYCAPALPLGDDFSGLVYLHGSARMDPGTLVLTDKDFGAAYLTRGWARDFLVPLFSKYTVLFVGYSHGDVTITYLARGLNRAETKPRWTMASSDPHQQGREHWESLDISIVEYPLDPDNALNQHQALTDFFSQWADHTKTSIVQRARRVRGIARGLPPERNTDSEYLNYCLRHSLLAQEFCSAIRHPAWVGWMYDHGYFRSVFEDVAPTAESEGDPHQVLTRWLCSYVRRRYPDLLLDLIQTGKQRLSRRFSQTLAQVLWSEQSEAPDARFAAWVSILLSQGRNATRDDIWAYLLNQCQLPEHLGIALSLFELLTTPEIRVDRSWNLPSFTTEAQDAPTPARKKAEYSISWPADAKYWFPKTWATSFKPHLPRIAEFLEQIVVRQLTKAHLILRDVGKANDRLDRLTFGRSSIAPHEQDENPFEECYSYLVDVLRDILSHWISTDPRRARVQIESWWSTKIPMLRRFSVYARSVDPQYGADENIDWILEHDLVFRSGFKKEIFDLLAKAYPGTSQAARKRLLRRIDRGFRGAEAKNLESATLHYERFNALVWLRQADGNCGLAQHALEIIQAVHPEFKARVYPEFDHWHSKVGFSDPQEGIDFDRILAESPGAFLHSMRRADTNSQYRDPWDDSGTLRTLFARDRDWGRQFTELLARESVADAQLWDRVFSACREIIKTNEDWHWIFDVINGLPDDRMIYAAAANLISNRVWSKDAGLDAATIDRAASIVDRAWTLCSTEQELPDDVYRDWLTSAINNVGGWIGEFWVHYCDHLRQRTTAQWAGIPALLKAKIREALSGINRVRVYARIALTPWIGYFFAWDRDFALNQFLPLFDWQRDAVVAQQTWSVLLNYNRGSSIELEKELIPYYHRFAERVMTMLKGAAEKSEQFDEHALQNLGRSLAGLAMQVIPDPVESGFFRDFLPLLPVEVRGALAIGIGNHLARLDDVARQQLWDTWLKRYLDLRLVGIPVALSVGESKVMLQWCLHLGPVFAEAVDLIAQMPQKAVFSYSIVKDLLENPALEKCPVHSCRLAIAALQADDFQHLHEMLLTLRQTLSQLIPGTTELKVYDELLFRLGWRKK